MLAYDQPIALRPPETVTAQPRIAAPGFNVLELLQILWNRKITIFAAAFVCACLAVAVGKTLTPKYVAVAQLYVDPRELQLVDRELTPRAQDLSGLAMVVESQARVITSNSVLLQVIKATKIDEDPEFGGPSPSAMGSLWSMIGIGGKPAADDATIGRTKTIDELNRHINVRRTDRTFIVDIEVWSRDPAKAAMLANAVSAAYMTESQQSQASAARRATTDLSGRLKELQERLRVAENNLAVYKANNNFLGTQDTLVSDQQLSSSTQRLVSAHALTLDAQAKFDQIEASRRGATDNGAISEALQSPTIANLRAQYADVRRRYAELSSELGSRHPALRTMEKQVEDIRKSINEELDRFSQSARNDLTRARDLEASLKKTLDAQKRQSVELTQASVQLRELEREVEASRNVYQSFLKRSRETEEQETLNTSSARIIGDATTPQRRTFPPAMSLLAMVGFMLGAFGTSAGFVAFSRPFRPHAEASQPAPIAEPDKRIAETSAKLLTQPASRPPGGLLEKPLITRLQESDVVRTLSEILAENPRDPARLGWPTLRTDQAFTPFLEAMRQLRVTVAQRSSGTGAPVMMAIGPAGNDDRVMTTLNMAIAAARDGAKVLLIDADHVEHVLSDKLEGFHAHKTRFRAWLGLAGIFRRVELGNGITIQPLMRGSDARSNSDVVSRAIARARSSGRYDLIIIDGPPMPWREPEGKLLELPDGLVAVLPVSLDINDCMEEIIEALDGAERKLVGVILNEIQSAETTQERQKKYA